MTDAHAVALRETFDAFYLREFPRMVAIASAVSGSAAAAEDIAQEAMLRAHRRWDRLSTYDKPGAWVRRVTINLATSTFRRARSEANAKLRLMGSASPVVGPPEPADEPIWEAVRQLPAKQRAAVTLFYLEDASVADLAEALGCSESTAKVHLHRGRQNLLAHLEEETS